MKNLLFLLFVLLTVCACGGNIEQKAQERLDAARKEMVKKDYSAAKLQLDTIRLLYPKAFKAREEGIKLMQQIELKEQAHTLAYLDSVLLEVTKEIESQKGNFIFEKSEQYQDEGNYLVLSQTVEHSIGRTFLRAQVSESGQMVLTSIFCRGNINHNSVKVMCGDSFAETPVSKDIYISKDLSGITEKVDYQDGADGNVIAFIATNKDSKMMVQYIGDKQYTVELSQKDKDAIASIYHFAQRLKARHEILKDIQEAKLKIRFINRKIQKDKKKHE